MSVCFFRSDFHPSWVEIREGSEVVRELEILFPLKKLPNIAFLTVEEAIQWISSTERKMAKNQALRWLARSALVSSILLRKLQDRGYCHSICREVVEECRQSGYLLDEETWSRMIERELERGYGPRWIEWKWKAKGLPEGLVAVIATPEKQREAMSRALRKLKKGDPKKIAQALFRRGFEIF